VAVIDVFVQPPSYYHKKPSELPAVESPHPGTSYRPAASDHKVGYMQFICCLRSEARQSVICNCSFTKYALSTTDTHLFYGPVTLIFGPLDSESNSK